MAVLVGRGRELTELVGALQAAEQRRGSLVLVSGEPGVGKTRLVEELSSHASLAGASVFWGGAWEGAAGSPLWPWRQVLRTLVRRAGHALERMSAAQQAALADVAPQAGAADPPPDPPLDSADTRFQLFEAVLRLLENAAGESVLVVVLDDLQFADPLSIKLLEFLAPRVSALPLLLVATHRENDPGISDDVSRGLATLARFGARIPLGSLAAGDAAAFARTVVGVEPPDSTVAEIWGLTGGNPFFMEEVLRLDSSTTGARRTNVTRGIRDAVVQRLEALPPEHLRVLRGAAVLGRAMPVSVLRDLTGMDHAELRECIAAAARYGALDTSTVGFGTVAFTHALVRDVLYDDIEPTARAELHAAAGHYLERYYAPLPDQHLAELAEHFFIGERWDRAAELSERAAAAAIRSLAFEDAASQCEQALEALRRAGSCTPEAELRILLSMADALRPIADGSAINRTLVRALELATTLGDTSSLVKAALGISKVVAFASDNDENAAILEAALASVPTSDPARVELLVQLARSLHHPASAARRAALVADAETLARRSGDVRQVARVVSVKDFTLWTPENLPDRLSWGRELSEMASRLGDDALMRAALKTRIPNALEAGDIREVDDAMAECIRLAVPDAFDQWRLTSWQAMLALLRGSIGEAEVLSDQAVNMVLTDGEPGQLQNYTVQLLAIRREQGRLAEIEFAITHALETDQAVPAWRAALAFVLAMTGQPARARAELDRLARDGFAALPRDVTWTGSLAALTETAATVGDPTRASELYDLMSPFSGRCLVVGFGDVCLGAADHYLGIAAAASGRHDLAVEHLERALEMNRRLGAPTLVARTDDALAQVRAAAPEPNIRAALRRHGDFWTVAYRGRQRRVRDIRGMCYLHCLLTYAGQELHATRVVALADGGEVPMPAASRTAVQDGLDLDAAGTDLVLDEHAVAAYRTRLAELQEEIDEAEAYQDPVRASHARTDMDAITAELSRSLGLGGRGRRHASAAERARVNVTRGIRMAIERIDELDPELGAHLATSVRTGVFCSYVPDRARVIEWAL